MQLYYVLNEIHFSYGHYYCLQHIGYGAHLCRPLPVYIECLVISAFIYIEERGLSSRQWLYVHGIGTHI